MRRAWWTLIATPCHGIQETRVQYAVDEAASNVRQALPGVPATLTGVGAADPASSFTAAAALPFAPLTGEASPPAPAAAAEPSSAFLTVSHVSLQQGH